MEIYNKMKEINIDMVTAGAFLYPELTKSSKVPPAYVKHFKGKLEFRIFGWARWTLWPSLSLAFTDDTCQKKEAEARKNYSQSVPGQTDGLHKRQKEVILQHHMEQNPEMKATYHALLQHVRKYESVEYFSEENVLQTVKDVSDVLNVVEYHLDELRAGRYRNAKP